MNSLQHKLLANALILTAAVFVSACGKGGSVSFQNASFPTSGSTAAASRMDFAATSTTPTATVEEFKICIARVKLQDDGDEVEKKDGNEEIEFTPGLVDVSSGAAKDWGSVDVPTGFKLKRVTVKVKKDNSKCGTDYSIRFKPTGGSAVESPQDVEFKFRFDPPVDLNTGDTVKLSLNQVVANLRNAVDSGTIASLKDRCEEVEGSATK